MMFFTRGFCACSTGPHSGDGVGGMLLLAKGHARIVVVWMHLEVAEGKKKLRTTKAALSRRTMQYAHDRFVSNSCI